MANKEIKISRLGTLSAESIKNTDIIPIVSNNRTWHVTVQSLLSSGHVSANASEVDIETSNLHANWGAILCWYIKEVGAKNIEGDCITLADLREGKEYDPTTSS